MFIRRLAEFISRFQTARLSSLLGVIQALALLVIFSPEPTKADDFQRDMRRLQDGLRTDGFAQTIATIASTVVVILVNGAEIGRTLIQPKDGKEGEEGPQRTLLLQVHTRDKTGATSTTLDPNTGEPVYIQACVIDATKGTIDAAATASIGLTLGPGAEAATLGTMPPQGGWRVAAVAARPPGELPRGAASVTAYVSASIDGTPINAPVQFTILDVYELRFY